MVTYVLICGNLPVFCFAIVFVCTYIQTYFFKQSFLHTFIILFTSIIRKCKFYITKIALPCGHLHSPKEKHFGPLGKLIM